MTRIIQEAAGIGSQMLGESAMVIELGQSDIDAYAASLSRNAQDISEQLEIPLAGAMLSEDGRRIILSDPVTGSKAVVFTEDHVIRELGSFLIGKKGR
jgi:hypothetical protein